MTQAELKMDAKTLETMLDDCTLGGKLPLFLMFMKNKNGKMTVKSSTASANHTVGNFVNADLGTAFHQGMDGNAVYVFTNTPKYIEQIISLVGELKGEVTLSLNIEPVGESIQATSKTPMFSAISIQVASSGMKFSYPMIPDIESATTYTVKLDKNLSRLGDDSKPVAPKMAVRTTAKDLLSSLGTYSKVGGKGEYILYFRKDGLSFLVGNPAVPTQPWIHLPVQSTVLVAPATETEVPIVPTLHDVVKTMPPDAVIDISFYDVPRRLVEVRHVTRVVGEDKTEVVTKIRISDIATKAVVEESLSIRDKAEVDAEAEAKEDGSEEESAVGDEEAEI